MGMSTKTKEATRKAIVQLCRGDEGAAQVLTWMNGAEREENEIVSMITGVNSDRESDELSDAENDQLGVATGDLWRMVLDGLLVVRRDGLETYYGPPIALQGRQTL
jgi:hypothetical protein